MVSAPTDYLERLRSLHAELGLAADWLERCSMPLCLDAAELADAGEDCFDRPQQMEPGTLRAWRDMRDAAAREGVVLELVSAYRSPEYQRDLLQRKQASGRSMAQLLTVNAAPGFSEHHTGCALDLNTPGCEPLSEQFENTAAFQWLSAVAGGFGFTLSYPRDNPWGLVYEPWHWRFRPR